ncbi:MAG: hypothetical protein K9N09_05680 [Candidatus Cloacimonetes bacterium]|nr:hypothetical protein [Candidatus Cloacimonadota bacterium]MCF7814704.1 hypothetical protein [Candidatus Cloacimonadota bacterium]MCF7868175.1 hypothetical protein [Candidatus Cloacimonadota bacterium]MCF7884473.1 hypothetical protein [Candidatus Cloacimonadota bacterium]
MKFILFVIILSILPLYAIDLNLPVSAVQNSANGLNLIHPTPASAISNPAILQQGIETSATYLFGMQELPYYNVHAVYSFGKKSLHLGESYLDQEYLTESRTNLAIGYKFNSFTFAGAVQILRNKVENYHDASSYLLNAGMVWTNSNFSSGIAVHNLSQAKFLELKLPITIMWESCYQITPNSAFSVGLEKEDDFDFSFKFAASYQPFQIMKILAGYQFEPDRIGIGTVFNLQKFKISYSIRTHQYLDLTQYISICYEI